MEAQGLQHRKHLARSQRDQEALAQELERRKVAERDWRLKVRNLQSEIDVRPAPAQTAPYQSRALGARWRGVTRADTAALPPCLRLQGLQRRLRLADSRSPAMRDRSPLSSRRGPPLARNNHPRARFSERRSCVPFPTDDSLWVVPPCRNGTPTGSRNPSRGPSPAASVRASSNVRPPRSPTSPCPETASPSP